MIAAIVRRGSETGTRLTPLIIGSTSGWDSDPIHPSTPRKYGRRTSSPGSSRSSGSSGLIEQFSSSDSSSGTGYAEIPTGESPSFSQEKTLKLSIAQKIQQVAIKRRARQNFHLLTYDSAYESESRELSRRRNAAEKLVEIAEREIDGGDVVARRFIKRAAKQESGVSALFKLCDLECDEGKREAGVRDNALPASFRLLKLVVSHSRDSTFYRNTLPTILLKGRGGLPAIVFLARSMPDLFGRTDATVLSHYLQKATEREDAWSEQWQRGILLINLWLLSQIAHGDHYEGTVLARISTTRFVLNEILPTCIPQVSSINPAERSYPRGWMMVFQAIISACTLAAKDYCLDDVLPPRETLRSFVELCVSIVVTSSVPDPSPYQAVGCGLALKALAMLRRAPHFSESIPVEERLHFEDICMTVVLDRTLWRREMVEERELTRWHNLRPEEDAFDILSRLPKPAFERALKSALNGRMASTDTTDSEHDRAMCLLDPLLWLSNMPQHIVEAHQALVQGGTCDFLTHIITLPVPEGSPIENRSLWRAKGEAITCLGNIVERMSHTELEKHITQELIEAVVAIKKGLQTPLVQKGQAVFTLQRYTLAADRTRVVCYHREEPSVDYQGSDVP